MCVTSFCSASGLPLYLAATLLYEGPSFCLSTEWQLRQPFFFTRASAAASSAASASNAPPASITAAIEAITFMVPLPFVVIHWVGLWKRVSYAGGCPPLICIKECREER